MHRLLGQTTCKGGGGGGRRVSMWRGGRKRMLRRRRQNGKDKNMEENVGKLIKERGERDLKL